MTFMGTPVVHVEGPVVLTAYEVTPPADGRRWFHVDLRSGVYGPVLLTFAGAMDDLHEVLLGLHNVLVDAAQSPDGRADTTVLERPVTAEDVADLLNDAAGPGRTWSVDEGPGADGVALGGG